jgi:hypothetical protein
MTAALEGGEWSAARPGRILPQERPGTHFTGGWVGPRAGLDGRQISSPPGFERIYKEKRNKVQRREKIKIMIERNKEQGTIKKER